VQWDYVRFPDVPQALMRTAHWPAQEGRSKADGIREFLLYSREQLASYDVPVTADVFGLTVSVRDDMGIGQLWEKMVDATDVLLPMVYPSHFARGSYGIAQPNAQPYETSARHASTPSGARPASRTRPRSGRGCRTSRSARRATGRRTSAPRSTPSTPPA
jgi:hypothetical protein